MLIPQIRIVIGNCLVLSLESLSCFSAPSVFLALQSVQVCEREALLRQAGGALSGEERVQFLKVVTDDEPYDHCCKYVQNNSNANLHTRSIQMTVLTV